MVGDGCLRERDPAIHQPCIATALAVVCQLTLNFRRHVTSLHSNNEPGFRMAVGHSMAVQDGVTNDLRQALWRFRLVRLVQPLDRDEVCLAARPSPA